MVSSHPSSATTSSHIQIPRCLTTHTATQCKAFSFAISKQFQFASLIFVIHFVGWYPLHKSNFNVNLLIYTLLVMMAKHASKCHLQRSRKWGQSIEENFSLVLGQCQNFLFPTLLIIFSIIRESHIHTSFPALLDIPFLANED